MKTIRILTSKEMQNIPAFLTTEEIEENGFVALAAKPSSARCPFCNKELQFLGARSLYRNVIIRWKDEPEKCSCKESENLDSVKNEEAVSMSGIIKMEIPDKDGNTILTIYEEPASEGLLLFCIDESNKKLGSAAVGLSVLVKKTEFLSLFSKLLGPGATEQILKLEPKSWEPEIMWD